MAKIPSITMLCLFLLGASASIFAAAPTPPLVKISAPFEEIDVTDADNGKSLSLERGEHLVVTLPDYSDGGYVWSLSASNSNPLTQLGQLVYQAPAGANIVGGIGKDTWSFQAESSGSTTLTFTCARPWEASSPLTVIQLNVSVASQTAGALQAELQVSETDKGKALYVRKGDLVVVTLPANPSTGFSWSVALSKAGFLTQSGDPIFKATPSTSNTPIVGAGGTDTWTFQASQPGVVGLTFGYARTLDGKRTPVAVFAWPVIIASP